MINGRWDGQPAAAPASASNKYVGFLVCDTFYTAENIGSNPYYLEIHGTNFGTQMGNVILTLATLPLPTPSPVSAHVSSWTNTKIRVKLMAPYTFRQQGYASPKVRFTVRTASNLTVSRNYPVVALIKSRGFGQCTWEVAYQRLLASLQIPSPNAYPITRIPIQASYEPRRYDVLYWGNNHTGIITSTPVATALPNGATKWTFAITERNWNWHEERHTVGAEFRVRNGQILQGIRSGASSLGDATKFWRESSN